MTISTTTFTQILRHGHAGVVAIAAGCCALVACGPSRSELAERSDPEFQAQWGALDPPIYGGFVTSARADALHVSYANAPESELVPTADRYRIWLESTGCTWKASPAEPKRVIGDCVSSSGEAVYSLTIYSSSEGIGVLLYRPVE